MSVTTDQMPSLNQRHRAVLPALQLARTPHLARRSWRVLLIALLLLPFVLALVPWTQSVHGTGRAIAFNPVQRPQFIVSPIEGRIKKWYVVEGDRVQAGQRIVEMVDNDPQLELRLLDEEKAILERLRAAEGRVRDIESRIGNLQASWRFAESIQSAVLQQAKLQLQTFDYDLIGLQADGLSMQQNHDRIKGLVEGKIGGLASEREREVAIQNLNAVKAKVNAQNARIELGKQGVKAADDNLKKVKVDTDAQIDQEKVSLGAAVGEVAVIQGSYAQIRVRVARQRAQYVDAPMDGIVFRLVAAGEAGGILVRPGERLAILVPDIKSGEAAASPPSPGQLVLALGHALAGTAAPGGPAGGLAQLGPLLLMASGQLSLTDVNHPGIVIELQIDGNDLPLVRKGDKARLQFEGWPAAQFVGWPSVAVGTFGGLVYLVDPTSDDKGRFRILVEPDPDDQPWPDERYLRQGVRGQGWVLLNRVTVGWELWRHLNGFPPVRAAQDKESGHPLGPVKSKGFK